MRMTIYRQLATSIIILFTVVFVGTTLITTGNLRSFIAKQLEKHAQDTATSLGLSLSPHMRQQDLPIINLMVDAIFDRGYFESIRLVDLDGNILVERKREDREIPAPDWFIRLVSFETPRMEAIVMSGWKQAGSVHVTSHPGFAYRELWSNTQDTFLLFLAVAIIILIASLMGLRLLLRPLHEVEKQAEAITERTWIQQEKLPRTRELRNVVIAMNKLTDRLREIFFEQAEVTEELRKQIYLDTVTGLANRQAFNRQCHTLIESSESATHGALILVRLDALKEVNNSAGYADGDKLLQMSARFIQEESSCYSSGIVARLSGGDFGIVIPGLDARDAEGLVTRLCDGFRRIQSEFSPASGNFAHIGITMWEPVRELSELLAESDHALRSASNGAGIGWHRYQTNTHKEPGAYGKEYWRSRTLEAVAEGNIKLYTQAVYSDEHTNSLLHKEILLRVPDGQGKYAPAGIYQPMIDSMDIAISLDKLVIEKLLAHIARDQSKVTYAVNLSSASVADPVFRRWLMESLEASGLAAGRVQLEMSESTAVIHSDEARDMINLLATAGYQTGLDHFGKNFHPFGYLRTLNPSYIKIDSYYTRGLCQNRDNQFFIKSLKDTVRTLGISVIAQSIETSSEYGILRSIKLDGYQGYLFGKPEALQP